MIITPMKRGQTNAARGALSRQRRAWAYVTRHPGADAASVGRALSLRDTGQARAALDALVAAGYIARRGRGYVALIPFVTLASPPHPGLAASEA